MTRPAAVSTPHARDVVELLEKEHRLLEQLLGDLRRARAFEARSELRDQVAACLVRHSVAEEVWIHPALRRHLPGGADAVERHMSQHDDLEILVEELVGLPVDDPGFVSHVARLQVMLAHHVAQEEDQQFPQLRVTAPGDALLDLGRHIERLERLAPVHRQPGAVSAQLLHQVVGPGAGMVGRLRDELTSRLA